MAKYALILIDGAITIDGHVYLKNEIAPNPGFGMTDKAEQTRDGIVKGLNGNDLFKILDEKEAKAIDADPKNPAKIVNKPNLDHFGNPARAKDNRAPASSIYTDDGAKAAGLDNTPDHPRAKADKAAKKEAEAQAKADAKAKADAEAKKEADAKAKASAKKSSKTKK